MIPIIIDRTSLTIPRHVGEFGRITQIRKSESVKGYVESKVGKVKKKAQIVN